MTERQRGRLLMEASGIAKDFQPHRRRRAPGSTSPDCGRSTVNVIELSARHGLLRLHDFHVVGDTGVEALACQIQSFFGYLDIRHGHFHLAAGGFQSRYASRMSLSICSKVLDLRPSLGQRSIGCSIHLLCGRPARWESDGSHQGECPVRLRRLSPITPKSALTEAEGRYRRVPPTETGCLSLRFGAFRSVRSPAPASAPLPL